VRNYVEGKGMNKNKRALMSMIVFLSVFCLSAIFYIPNLSATKVSIPTDTKVTGITEPNTAATTPTKDNEFQTYSYSNSAVEAVPVYPEQSTQLTAEANDIQAKEASQATTDTTKTTPVKDATSETSDNDTPQEPETKEKVQKEALYTDIGISIAKDFVNIRKEASTDSDVLGKLYRDSAVEILSTSGDWYKVESGSVKGYVKSEFIKTGIPDDELVNKYGELSIIVSVDGLNVREKADTESDKLTVIYRNEIYPVLESDGDWIKINIPEDNTAGYVKQEYTEMIVDFKDAVSKEEEEELLKLQAEERAKKETDVKQQEGVSYSKEELKLLACLVHSEAGTQSYEGKLAVANVVLNRVKSSKYGGTIKSVIYQPGQFSVAKSGSLAKQLANYENYNSQSQKLSIKAAKAALEGSNNIGTRLYFHSYKSAIKKGYDKKKDSVKLGDHLFW
jgi:spore germination cell wall hydrolase CwlJ-like protein